MMSTPDGSADSNLLAQIIEVGNSLHRNLNVDSLLNEIAQAVHQSLEFGAVVVNLIDEDNKQVRVAALAGLGDEGRQLLEDAVYTWEEFAGLLQERFRIGRCYFVPCGEFSWDSDFHGPVYVKSDGEAGGAGSARASSPKSDDRWHPDDALLVPIELRQGQIAGIVSVDQPLDGRRPGPHTLQALEIFAQQAAIAIENARLFEQAQQEIAERRRAEAELERLFEKQAQRSDELATLNEIVATVNRSRDLPDLLQTVLDKTMDALGYETGLISLADQVTGHLHLASHRGLPDPMVLQFEQRRPSPGLTGTLCEMVLQTGETLAIADIRQEAPTDVYSLIRHGLFAYAGTPLLFQARSLGILCLFSRSVRHLSAERLSLLEAIGHQIGVGIANARLLAETQRALQEVEAMHQQYLHQEWHSFLASRHDTRSVGYLLTERGLKPTSQTWSPEIELATQTRKPVVVTGTHAASTSTGAAASGQIEDDDAITAFGARSALAAPIMLRGQVIGALDLFDPNQTREWTDDDLALVEAVTSQVALAVENARLFEKTQAALGETEILYRASRRITTSPDLPTLYQTLVDEMANRLGADQCQLTIFDRETGYGIIVAEYRPTSEGHNAPLLMTDCPAYLVLRDTGQPLAIEDVSAQPDLLCRRGADCQSALVNCTPSTGSSLAGGAEGGEEVVSASAQDNIKSLLMVPILVRGELIGSLEIQSEGQRRAFSEAELDFCQTLASQAAITIENMRAFEEQKETAERLREVDKLKTQFLANMSHELRTPLNSIIGFSRVILKGIDGPLTDMQETDLTSIYNSGQHLLGLINDILDLSKIEAGKMELNFDEVDLKPIIKGVMSTAVGLVKDRPIELKQEVPDDLPNVWADATRIRQVLLNLVSNATKFTEEGTICLTASHNDECIIIRVIDTGVGIPQEKLESIFEEFTQVDGSTTRSVGGTGLGLPISRHFIEKHGGEITAHSELGVGSTFAVTLPAYSQTQPGQEPVWSPAEGEASSTRERRLVLTVDDDPGVISLYRRYLESEGYQVVGISNSEEVLDVAVELQPYAIALDVLMPGKDGWQVLRELKACPQTQHIPIIMCTIVGNEGLGFSLGAADYLAKPIMEEELLAALSLLDQWEEEEIEVLVIDDQADDILLIRRMLEAQHRYRVTEADGGQSGIDLVHQRKPDIIVLDLMMPEVDGFAVLEALKRDPDTRDIPVVVITAKEVTKDEQRKLSGQVEVLLRKGLFSEQELLEDLGNALSRMKSH